MTRTRISLVTLGDPAKQSGGYLYHRRLQEAAPRHGAELRFESVPERSLVGAILGARTPLLRASTCDVVVIDSIAAAFVSPWLRSIRTPVAGMLHQGPGGIDHGPARTRVQSVLDRRAYPSMRTLLVASESLADELRGMHPDIRVVPPGRDVAPEASSDVRELRLGRRIALLCVGNWVERKGIIDLLDAFAMLPEGSATLHLVGDTATDPRYAKRVRERLHQLGSRVVVHGVVPKETVAAFYRDADAFVMPSLKEPYGTVYGEAMAMGLPVVGWRAGNLPYLARDGREGLIVEPGNIGALASALRRLAEDEALRRSMGEAARSRAAMFPTWDDSAAMFFGYLREVARRTDKGMQDRTPDPRGGEL